LRRALRRPRFLLLGRRRLRPLRLPGRRRRSGGRRRSGRRLTLCRPLRRPRFLLLGRRRLRPLRLPGGRLTLCGRRLRLALCRRLALCWPLRWSRFLLFGRRLRPLRLAGGRLALRGGRLRLPFGSRRLLLRLGLGGLLFRSGRLGRGRRLRQDQGVVGPAVRSRHKGQDAAGEQKGSLCCHIHLPWTHSREPTDEGRFSSTQRGRRLGENAVALSTLRTRFTAAGRGGVAPRSRPGSRARFPRA
jgi:hypothetical protein